MSAKSRTAEKLKPSKVNIQNKKKKNYTKASKKYI